MAYNPLIVSWVSGYSSDGTDMTLPIATFPRLTAAEADNTTGDFRKWLFAILEYLNTRWVATASPDRPANLTIARTQSLDPSNSVLTQVYVITVKTNITDAEVVNEAT